MRYGSWMIQSFATDIHALLYGCMKKEEGALQEEAIHGHVVEVALLAEVHLDHIPGPVPNLEKNQVPDPSPDRPLQRPPKVSGAGVVVLSGHVLSLGGKG